MNNLQLIQKLKTIREDRDMTQSEVADKAGIRDTYLARLESGKSAPKIGTVRKIAKALGYCVIVDLVKEPT